jgi:hypothetical protein
VHGFDEEVVGVGFALMSLGGLADVHGALYTALHPCMSR